MFASSSPKMSSAAGTSEAGGGKPHQIVAEIASRAHTLGRVRDVGRPIPRDVQRSRLGWGRIRLARTNLYLTLASLTEKSSKKSEPVRPAPRFSYVTVRNDSPFYLCPKSVGASSRRSAYGFRVTSILMDASAARRFDREIDGSASPAFRGLRVSTVRPGSIIPACGFDGARLHVLGVLTIAAFERLFEVT